MSDPKGVTTYRMRTAAVDKWADSCIHYVTVTIIEVTSHLGLVHFQKFLFNIF